MVINFMSLKNYLCYGPAWEEQPNVLQAPDLVPRGQERIFFPG